MTSVFPYLFLLFLLVFPSSNLQNFNGLPVSHWPEFLATALVVPFLCFGRLRQRAAEVFRKTRLPNSILIAAGAAAFALKAGLLISGARQGFAGCYSSPAEWAPTYAGGGPNAPCERSYEDLFRQSGATRMDRTIDFGPEKWNLSFLNSRRFDYYAPVAGSIPRDRIPVDIQWTGRVALEKPSQVVVDYVGEGSLSAGAEVTALPPAYDQARRVILELPAGNQEFVLTYRFDDGSRTGQDEEAWGPQAQIRINFNDGSGNKFLQTSSPALFWILLAAATDLLLAVLLFIPLLAFLMETWKDKWLILCVAGMLAVIFFLPLSQRVRGLGMTAVLIGFWLWRVFRRPLQPATVFAVLFGVCLGITLLFLPSPQSVVMRSALDDPLTLESHAFDILSSGSLEAGEPVFFAQPMFRYIKFFEHALFGDGGTFYVAAQLAFFFGGAFFLFESVLARVRSRRTALLLAAIGCVVFFLGGYYVSIVIRSGLSEYPTWSLLLWILPTLFLRESTASRLFCLTALAFCFTIRTNQAFAVAFLMILVLRDLWKQNRRVFAGGILAAGVIVLLPLFHNLYYGHEFVLTTSSMATEQNLPVPPSVWIASLQGDSSAAAAVSWHLQELFLLADVPFSTRLVLAGMAACLLIWLPVLFFAFARRRSARIGLLLSVPLLYLAPHLFFDAGIYYPRLFFIGYLCMAAATAVWIGLDPGKDAEKPAVLKTPHRVSS